MHRQELFGCRQNKTGGKRSALLFIRVCVCAFYGAKAFFFFFALFLFLDVVPCLFSEYLLSHQECVSINMLAPPNACTTGCSMVGGSRMVHYQTRM